MKCTEGQVPQRPIVGLYTEGWPHGLSAVVVDCQIRIFELIRDLSLSGQQASILSGNVPEPMNAHYVPRLGVLREFSMAIPLWGTC